MDINVKPKFYIDENVYCIEDYEEYPCCDICEGNKKVTIKHIKNDFEIECPNCNGTGKAGDYTTILWKMRCGKLPWLINCLHISIYKYDIPEFSYGATYKYEDVGGCSSRIEELNCFKTLEEALAEIEKRNANPEKRYEE